MNQSSSADKNLDDNVEDIVTSVQKVLNEEVEAKKNTTNEHNVLDTPDVSSTWSIILPAIFGNTGDDIRPHKPQIVMTPDSVIVDATEKTAPNKVDVKVKPSNSGSVNKIDDPKEKKPVEKPTITEEPIVHITKKKPVHSAFEASTPRSSVGGYHEHTINEIHSNHNHSYHGYRRKTTAATENPSTEDYVKASKPTPSRFVTRRRPTTESQKVEIATTVTTPQFDETTVEQSTRAPIKESTEAATELATELATESATELATERLEEGSTEEDSASVISTTVSDFIEPLTIAVTESIVSSEAPELTTYEQKYDETTTVEAASDIATTQTENLNQEHTITTEYPTMFDSSNSFNQIIESLKDDESVEMLTESNGVASTIFDDLTTTESFMAEHSTDRSTIKVPSIDIIHRINQSSSVQSNVYLNQEMFVDEQEPLVFDIPTTTDFSVDTTEYREEEATNKDEDLALPVFQEVKLQYPESSSIFEEKNPIVQQIDNFIHENAPEIVDSLAVESVDHENKVANVVSLDNLTLSEFIGQAATVASILSNDKDNIPIKEIVNQLVLSPQLRHDEPIPTTNKPASFHEMEVLSLRKEEPLIPADDVSYETSVIKETSSVSMSSNQPEVKLSKKPTDSLNNAAKNQLSSELLKVETDASTEISVESDVHEVMNMVKLKMPPKVVSVPSLIENRIKEEITTFATITEMNEVVSSEKEVVTSEQLEVTSDKEEVSSEKEEVSTEKEEFATVRLENEATTETQDDNILSTTVHENIETFDQTTMSQNIEQTSQTTNRPAENEPISGNFVADIFNTIGMIDEDVLAEKFNYTFNEEEDNGDIDDDLLNESSTISNDMTTKSQFEQTTNYNHYEEEIENEIIKKLQETLEERLNPKTESDQILFTTESPVETTTTVQIELSTNKELEVAAESESVPTEEAVIDDSVSEKIESTTEMEVNDNTITTMSYETTELSMEDEKSEKIADESNLSLDEATTESPTTEFYPKDEEVFIKLGETTIQPTTQTSQSENDGNTQASIINVIPSKKYAALKIDDRTSGISKPSQHFRPHSSDQKLFHVNTAKPSLKMPPSINTLKIKVSNSNRRPTPVKLDPAPKQALGLEQTTADANEDILEFTKLCNEIAFTFWTSLTSEGISSARSLVISPFALTSMLAMIFLGARGSTSGEMNEMLRLDDMVTFNPHLIFRNITDSVENTRDSGIANSAFVRELFSDRSKGKILSFYKDKAQQFYSGHVEEVNFNVINDIIRRRTNLLVKRHTWSKITEYIKTNNVWLNPPLAGLSANIFQTDCSKATVNERDGEMFFQVLPAIRQRRLVPIPAAVYKAGSGFMAGLLLSLIVSSQFLTCFFFSPAGYDPEIDATAVAFGGTDVVSTIFVMPGQQGTAMFPLHSSNFSSSISRSFCSW